MSSLSNGTVGGSVKRKSLVINAGPHGFRIKDRANSGGLESTSAADEFLAQLAARSRASQEIFVGTIKKRSAVCSKSSWTVRGVVTLDTSWTVNSSRAHERFANSAPMISGVLEKTIAWRNPSRCKMRSKRSSKLTPHNSINASGASATKIGRIFSIAREINGGAASCQLSAASRAARVAGVDQAVFHLMDPIAGFGDGRVMGCQEQSF